MSYTPPRSNHSPSRRVFVRKAVWGASALGAAALWTPGVLAEELMRTPRQTAGPFYPDRLPLDTDNDLIVINDAVDPSLGEITHFTGTILSTAGEPIRGAMVEIWQCDAGGAYLHSRTGNADNRDSNFQGYGRFLTGSSGEYYFRTIKPVPYPGRTPHIHVAVTVPGQETFTTQCYIKGLPMNERDGIFMAERDEAVRNLLAADFTPLAGSQIGELEANFDVVLGLTPEG